ncbi:MAG: OmpA family protein [Gammaproteobacteria bacterium]
MKTTTGLYGIGLALALALMGGCASQPKLTQDQIMSQFPQVASLDAALKSARTKGSEMLAPESYASANKSLKAAVDAAENNNDKEAEAEAAKGLKIVNKLNRDTESSREILSDVMAARDRAYAAGVASLQKEKIVALDADLKNTATLVEDGKIEKAKQTRPSLMAAYQQLELASLKQGTVNLAKSAIANAKEQGADKYAPVTLKRAEEQMALATTILDADRSQTEKAEIHAKKAKWYADQSAGITETVKDFDRRDFTMEDVVLWHQQQLTVVNEPLGVELPFNQSTDKAVNTLRTAVSDLVKDRAQLKASGEKVGQQLAMTEKDRQAAIKKEREDQQKFDMVQAMFTVDEANVYRQRQDVLISAHGFQFPSGQSEIQTINFPLINKITRAIRIFPNARIEVLGHTDSLGDDVRNQVLSNARAQKVAKFLVELGGVSPDKVMARGYGESRPVATNETREGRAENRRVEVKIVNE